MTEGLYDVDLGGGLFKKRIARTGQGKSGGYRVGPAKSVSAQTPSHMRTDIA
jgi:hypothetical protein